ncbi:MAG: hypothetical protein EOP48_11605 [Sphingobacteriales bacterium]|nr:MAG: hypothetical protein EOP48_11605 [Sphingobacteriales bacterium]
MNEEVIDKGWIALYRKLLDSSLWKEESEKHILIFIYLILKANHTPHKMNEGLTIQRGQHLTNVREIMAAMNNRYSYDQIVGCLKDLHRKGYIVKRRQGSRMQLITVRNYEKYQNRTESRKAPNRIPNPKPGESSYGKRFEETSTSDLTEHETEQNAKKHRTKKNNDSLNNNYTEEQKEKFGKLTAWIDTHCPSVAKMEEPITIEQYLLIRKNYLPEPSAKPIW